MQSHRILFYGAAFLLLIWTVFDGGNGGLNVLPVHGYREKFLDVPEGFSNDKRVNCDVKGEMKEGENPDQCWAFQGNDTTGQKYKDAVTGNCCHTVYRNADVPDSLSGIVEVNDIEIRIWYKKYLTKQDRRGLLIPLLSRLPDTIEFSIEFKKVDTCQEFIDYGIDNIGRIVIQMIHFSYTRQQGSILQERLSHVAYNLSYLRECGICDEHLYLPETSGLPYTFRIGKLPNGMYGWLNPEKKEKTNYFARPESNYADPWDKNPSYTNVQRFDKFCTTKLRKWKHQVDEKDAYYLPFRLLWPSYATYLKDKGKIADVYPVSLDRLDICDYVIIFKREHYSLLAKKIEATAQGKRRRRMSENVSDEAVEARWHRNFASKLMQK